MNSSAEIAQINLNNLVQSVMLCLVGDWKRKIDSENLQRCELIRTDGLRLVFLSGGGWAKPGKIYVTFSRPRDAKGGWVEIYDQHSRIQDPSINVSATKSGEQIAADIARRLLPESERIFALANEKINSENTSKSKRDSLLSEMCQAAGVEVRKPRGNDNWDYSFYLNESGCGSGEVSVNYGGTVQIKLPSLSPEKAKELIAFLQSNTFAAPVATESAS